MADSKMLSYWLANNPSGADDVTSLQLKQLQAQRQNALAQALTAQALKGSGSTQMAGNVAIRNSPLSAIAQALQGYIGTNLGQESDKGMSDAMVKQMQLEANGVNAGFQSTPPENATTATLTPAQFANGVQPAQMGPDATPQPPSQVPTQPNQGTPGPLALPTAMPISQQKAIYMQDPAAYATMAKEAYAPQTELAKLQLALKLAPPNSPQAAQIQAQIQRMQTAPGVLEQKDAGLTAPQIQAGALGKLARESEIGRKMNDYYLNPITGERGFTPKIPEYSQPTGPIGPGGQIPGVAPIPGAQGVAQGNAQAAATGSASGGIQSVTMPDGRVVPMRGAQAAPVGAPGNTPGNTPQFPPGIPRPGVATVTPVQFGQSTESAATTKSAVERGDLYLKDLNSRASNSSTRLAGLDEIEQIANKPGAQFGPGTGERAALVAKVNGYFGANVLPMEGRVNQEQITKLANLLSIGKLSGGTDAQLATIKGMFPNGEITNEGIKKLVPFLRGQEKLIQAEQRAANNFMQNGGSQAKLDQFRQKFEQVADPRALEIHDRIETVRRSNPQAAEAMIKNLPPDMGKKLSELYKLGAF